jgi:hypothetical protein
MRVEHADACAPPNDTQVEPGLPKSPIVPAGDEAAVGVCGGVAGPAAEPRIPRLPLEGCDGGAPTPRVSVAGPLSLPQLRNPCEKNPKTSVTNSSV